MMAPICAETLNQKGARLHRTIAPPNGLNRARKRCEKGVGLDGGGFGPPTVIEAVTRGTKRLADKFPSTLPRSKTKTLRRRAQAHRRKACTITRCKEIKIAAMIKEQTKAIGNIGLFSMSLPQGTHPTSPTAPASFALALFKLV